ncbi:hypothetical protein [Labrenzia sp. OB1]|uniref:hypothetical protein n=1 Tax=Labrenzia sp. OB1 TaxID=1561204 RepID=UPI0007B23580|nr:hypothetical protein [Labrenzia sp. OB1]KZM51601.1 hypothetical protein OA90_04015 [Labrenzia sp. OB1]
MVAILTGILSAQAQSDTGSALSPAFLQARAAYDTAWETSGLAFDKVTLTDGSSQGYGQYTPRASSAYGDGEPLSVYAEPVGYDFRQTGDSYAYELTASYRLLNLSGQVLAEQGNFASFAGSGLSKKRELSASLNFQFSGLPSGDYKLEATFTDAVGGKQASFSLPFSVTAAN